MACQDGRGMACPLQGQGGECTKSQTHGRPGSSGARAPSKRSTTCRFVGWMRLRPARPSKHSGTRARPDDSLIARRWKHSHQLAQCDIIDRQHPAQQAHLVCFRKACYRARPRPIAARIAAMAPLFALFKRSRRAPPPAASILDEADAVCAVTISRPSSECQRGRGSKLGLEVRSLARLLGRGDHDEYTAPASQPEDHPAPSKGCASCLAELPPAPAFTVWAQLPRSSKAALLSACKASRAVFSRSVQRLSLSGSDARNGPGLGGLSFVFPDLNELELHGVAEGELSELKAARWPHLHSFSVDVKLRGASFHAVGRFIVLHPSLTRLALPNQRCSAPADQRVLAAVLEALPGLTHLDLGGSAAVSSSGASNAISPSVLRRIVRLRGLRSLAANAAAVPDGQLGVIAELRRLQSLRLAASGDGRALASALAALSELTVLELEHATLTSELAGCLGGLRQLRVLALGLCPRLKDDIMAEIGELTSLQKLRLPFSLSASHLRLLSRLPHLAELFSWRHVELDVLGPSHAPLAAVTRLVASSINGRDKPLSAWFPGLESLCLKHCSDMAALSLRGSTTLQVLQASECAKLSNDGFAALRGLKGLQRLSLDSAAQLSDAAFTAVFSATMPALQQFTLSGCPGVSDHGLQLLTASCRRLSSISLSSCRLLSDKTLKRLAHCEHLSSVALRACGGFTHEGVCALAAAPHMRSVTVTGCSGVHASLCRSRRSGVRVRVD